MGKNKPGTARGVVVLNIKVLAAREAHAGEVVAMVSLFGQQDTVTLTQMSFTMGPRLATMLEGFPWLENLRIQAALIETIGDALANEGDDS